MSNKTISVSSVKSSLPTSHGREKTQDVKSRLGITFESFSLKENLMKGIIAKSYYEPTPVQEESIPHILHGRDALIRSKNGTGKTATYLIPILNMIDTSITHIQAIILLPTRELVIQTVDNANDLAKFMDIKIVSIVGGCPLKEDMENIRRNKPAIAIGTTTRIEHLIGKGIMKIESVKFLVLDEADQVIMNDRNHSLNTIMKHIKNVQTVLISATFPDNISRFQEKYMNDPIHVNLMQELTLIGITQFYVYLTEEEKLSCLNTLFHKLNINQCIVFCNSIKRVVMLAERLNSLGYPSLAIHSKMPQLERTNIFNEFRHGKLRFMISSDLCNRGIDVQSVNVVINFDMPRKSSTYLHRIGRSGRYGNYAISISMLTQMDNKYLELIERELDTKIQPTPPIIPESLYVS